MAKAVKWREIDPAMAFGLVLASLCEPAETGPWAGYAMAFFASSSKTGVKGV